MRSGCFNRDISQQFIFSPVFNIVRLMISYDDFTMKGSRHPIVCPLFAPLELPKSHRIRRSSVTSSQAHGHLQLRAPAKLSKFFEWKLILRKKRI